MAACASPLKSLGITHVQYDAQDPLAKGLAIVSLSPFAVISVYLACLFLARRDDILAIETLSGQIACEIFNAILKWYIAQPRPHYGTWRYGRIIPGTEGVYLGKGHGMPSSHAQFVGFVFGWLTIMTMKRLGNINRISKAFFISASGFLALIVGYSRVHLSYHTFGQVVVGEFIGVSFSLFWYFFTERILRDAGVWDRITDSYIGRILRLRDYGRTPGYGAADAEMEEYERWRALLKSKDE